MSQVMCSPITQTFFEFSSRFLILEGMHISFTNLDAVKSEYTVSQKKQSKLLFSSELRQISTNFDNFWHKDGQDDEIMWGAPHYLPDHPIPASDAAPRRGRLRSANRNCLTVPRCRLSTYGCRAFDYAGPSVWNSLPDELRNSDRFGSFKRFMKTILL